MASALTAATSMEACARTFAQQFYEEYAQSAVLVRAFATLRFADLPTPERLAARAFAAGVEGSIPIADDANVLTLLGTYGVEPAWRDRTASRGHRAIPLISNTFVAEVPMIARLLSELGFATIERSTAAWQYVHRATEGSGIFFVGDARTATDERGRRIIPATDFVEGYNVRTVFGFGGPGARADGFLTVIVFSRDTLTRTEAQRYASLSETLRIATGPFEREGAIFAD